MSKIVCDICGTTYPDTADCCPICGCSKDSAMDFLGESFETEELTADSKKGRFAARNRKEIFDYDEVNSPAGETVIPEEEMADDEEEQNARPNTGVIIGLTVAIALVLLVTAFMVFRYILPNLGGDKPEPTKTILEDPATETTSNYIPCQNLVMSNGAAQLSEPGQYFLLHITPSPENTSDMIVYASADESVATVSQDGRITAVAEGETVVFITCGNLQLKCPVTVSFQEETQPTTEETVAETQAEEQGEEVAEETEEQEPAQSGLKNVTLKLKKNDIMLGVGYAYRLILDCDLDPSEVEWSVEHSHIASVDDEGLVKALKSGTTAVTVKYGDQEIKCMVRCG